MRVKTESEQHAEVDVGPPGAATWLEGIVSVAETPLQGVCEALGLVAAALSPELLWKSSVLGAWGGGQAGSRRCPGWR